MLAFKYLNAGSVLLAGYKNVCKYNEASYKIHKYGKRMMLKLGVSGPVIIYPGSRSCGINKNHRNQSAYFVLFGMCGQYHSYILSWRRE